MSIKSAENIVSITTGVVMLLILVYHHCIDHQQKIWMKNVTIIKITIKTIATIATLNRNRTIKKRKTKNETGIKTNTNF